MGRYQLGPSFTSREKSAIGTSRKESEKRLLMANMDEILRVGSDDILYRLRQEERERAEAIRLWRANACSGSILSDSHIHELAGDAAREIVRLRLKLHEAGLLVHEN